jgi:hypothetical protein
MKLVREYLNEDFYPGPPKKEPIGEIDQEHANMLAHDIGEWLDNYDIEIWSIYAMNRGEGDWWIDCAWYDRDEFKVKHAYLTCSPNIYQHNIKNLQYATHGFPLNAKQIYVNPEIED